MTTDTMAIARNIVNQVLDESGADVDTRQRINDACDQFAERLISVRVVDTLKGVLADLANERSEAWDKYLTAPGNGVIESLRQGKFEGLDRAVKRVQKQITEESGP